MSYYENYNGTNFSDLMGKTLKSISNTGGEIILETVDGERFKQYHCQDCCENVRVEEVIGDFDDLIGSPILLAEESTNDDEGDSCTTWTFYKLATIMGNVTIRWLGESNGYYSVGVSFVKLIGG
jgi:hypothetical protein